MNIETPDHVVNVVAISGVGGGVSVGLTIGQLNQYLQAAAFIVAIVSGICASIYYITKSCRKD